MYFGGAIGRANNDFSGQCMADFRHRKVRTDVHSRRARKKLQRAEVADPDDVKLPVSQLRFRRDLHPTAEESSVRHAEVRDDEISFARIVELNDEARAFAAK